MMRFVARLARDESGQGLVEYALVLVLVSTIAIAALNLLGSKANNSLSSSANHIPS